jgi:beta-glucosidase
MRTATHNILYTTVNSWAYDAEHTQGGMQAWKKILVAADILLGVLLLTGMMLAYRKYKKQA